MSITMVIKNELLTFYYRCYMTKYDNFHNDNNCQNVKHLSGKLDFSEFTIMMREKLQGEDMEEEIRQAFR